ncbi:hypothetical protein ABMA28_003916 [Loxostege sticticalis]|uniref:Uncharacterized protein n=1 Tax=Loxostege sticticalis TaxID=481309 RepID=A0ABD0SU14_LOXSC
MCWSKKCCYVVELDKGCLTIGILTLMLSVGVWIVSTVLFCADENDRLWYMHNATEHLLGAFHLDVNQRSKEVILSIILFVAVGSTMTSIALIVGVRKRLAGYVLVYFAYSTFLTFFMSLSSLLLMLKTTW